MSADQQDEKQTDQGPMQASTSRRRLLILGAATVPAAITLNGGAAWATSSTCDVILRPQTDEGVINTDPGKELILKGSEIDTASNGSGVESLISLKTGKPVGTGQVTKYYNNYKSILQDSNMAGHSCLASFMIKGG